MTSRQPLDRKKPLWRQKTFWLAVVLLIAAGGGAAWYFLGRANTAQAQTAGPSSTRNIASVTRGDLQVTVIGSGTLSTARSADLSFSTGGTVSVLNVKLGDDVTAGQVLAQIDNASSFEASIAALELDLLEAQQTLNDLQDNASLSLAQAYQDWVAAKSSYQNALTASQRTAYTRCSQEVATRTKGALDLAQANLEKLGTRSYGTDAWINAKNSLDQAQANYQACFYSEDDKTSARAELDVAKIALDQAEARYQTLSKSAGIDPDEVAVAELKIETLRLELAQAREDLNGITLTAPFDGRVVYLASGAGTMATTEKYITVADVNQPEIEVSVDEADMDKFVIGSKASVTFDALPDQSFDATVTLVQPTLSGFGNYRVLMGTIRLDDRAVKTVRNLPLGLNSTVTIIFKEVQDTLLIPATALKEITGKGYQVTLVNADGSTRAQDVKIGLIGSEFAEVLSGLDEGDQILSIVENASSNSSQQFPGGMMPPDGGPPPMP